MCIREIICLGRNGAALAAFGDMVVLLGLTVLLEPSGGDRNEGVKLGESTFRDFLGWLHTRVNGLSRCSDAARTYR